MIRRKSPIPFKKERSLLSDVLPYEVPISFSNRHLYAFVLRHRIEIKTDTIEWQKDSEALDRIVCLIFCFPYDPDRISDFEKYIGKKERTFRRYNREPGGSKNSTPDDFLTPFTYKIKHKESEFRELCVPHPRSQLLVSDFYDQCKETILYYTSLSPFSIRAPVKIARYTYHRDKLHKEMLSTDTSQIEIVSNEYENLKSFFVYREYSNIHRFYESYRYHRSEKKYNNLFKLDISKCFDSIYTHSLGWATVGKLATKEAIHKSKGSFPSRFDTLMQQMNMGETNGIIIGPEFSRIFAEIVLQAIDCEVKNTLISKKLEHRVDYEVFRYVDDYFIFYNKPEDKELILNELQHTLKKYKLYLNSEKAVEYAKPIITEITVAKQQITRLLEKEIHFELEIDDSEDSEGESKILKGNVYINSSYLITAFKTIIKTCGVKYKDMLNYTLTIVERKCKVLINRYQKLESVNQQKYKISDALMGIIEFVFFIYSVSPRVNTTIRLCRILEVINAFLKSGQIESFRVQMIQKLVYDNICFILKKNKSSEHTQVETLYLLFALTELGREYWLEQDVLADYLGIKLDYSDKSGNSKSPLNYFSITVSLFYMRDKHRYRILRTYIINEALQHIRNHSKTCHKEAEFVLLLFDLISCPYVPEEKKKDALQIFGVSDPTLASDILRYTEQGKKPLCWFTNWFGFDFAKELDAKQSQEVY